MIAKFKFKLYFDNSSLMVVCTNDPEKKYRKELDLVHGFNSGEINNIKNLPIESGWEKAKFKYDFTEKDGQEFGMMSERDLQNQLKSDPKLHNKVHLFTNTKDGRRYWSVFFLKLIYQIYHQIMCFWIFPQKTHQRNLQK